LLLLWIFIAGIMKDMDQSATTQAYVSGMKEGMAFYGNELNWFQPYFSIAYAIFIVPSHMLQIKLPPSLWLLFAEIAWGVLTFVDSTHKAKTAATIYILHILLGALGATSWPEFTALIMTWYTPTELAFRLAIFNESLTRLATSCTQLPSQSHPSWRIRVADHNARRHQCARRLERLALADLRWFRRGTHCGVWHPDRLVE
ncbi:hypothetical protein BU25DRAFT_351316, partial [Macroventuria anomochaeta]